MKKKDYEITGIPAVIIIGIPWVWGIISILAPIWKGLFG